MTLLACVQGRAQISGAELRSLQASVPGGGGAQQASRNAAGDEEHCPHIVCATLDVPREQLVGIVLCLQALR